MISLAKIKDYKDVEATKSLNKMMQTKYLLIAICQFLNVQKGLGLSCLICGNLK